MGTRVRRQFERLADHLEELYTEHIRFYALKQTSGAPSSPMGAWETGSGGGEPGDRVGTAAVKLAELERRIHALDSQCRAEIRVLEGRMACLRAREKSVLRLRYFDRRTWEVVAEIAGLSERGAREICRRAMEKMEKMEGKS